MLIVWKRRGIFIAVVIFAWLLAIDWATAWYFGDAKFYASHGWPKLLGFWGSAATVFALRRALGVSIPAGEIALGHPNAMAPDTPTAQVESELFFVRARYWPALLAGLGVVLAFV